MRCLAECHQEGVRTGVDAMKNKPTKGESWNICCSMRHCVVFFVFKLLIFPLLDLWKKSSFSVLFADALRKNTDIFRGVMIIPLPAPWANVKHAVQVSTNQC